MCKLHRSIYGLKIAPKRWFEKLRKVLLKLGFKPFVFKPCIYKWKFTKNNVSKQLILIVYVDDILLLGDCPDKILNVVKRLQEEFKVSDLGIPKNFLGIELVHDKKHHQLFLHQQKYLEKILNRFGLDRLYLPPTNTPMVTLEAQRKRILAEQPDAPNPTLFREAIGSLIHLANGTRPDISFAVNTVSRAQSAPSGTDWAADLRIFAYLKSTLTFGLLYRGTADNIECYVDASLGTNDANALSTAGYVILAHGDVVSWRTKKQTHVALSSSEAEYIAASMACRQVVTLNHLLSSITKSYPVPVMYEDNKTAIALAKSLEAKSLKHVVHLAFHYIRFEVLNKNIELRWTPSATQLADIFTKALSGPKFTEFRDRLIKEFGP